MATILGKVIKPINMASKINNQFSTAFRRGEYIQRLSPRFAATSSEYHYHEKPPAHKHDKLWKAERYLSIGLLGVLPAAAMIPHPIMDYAMAVALVTHVHWGIEAAVVDYVRPSLFGTTIPKVSIGLVYILSSLALGGLFMFNYTDIGLTQAVRMIAKI